MSIYNNFIVDVRNNKGHKNDFFLISNRYYTVNSEVNGLLIKKTNNHSFSKQIARQQETAAQMNSFPLWKQNEPVNRVIPVFICVCSA